MSNQFALDGNDGVASWQGAGWGALLGLIVGIPWLAISWLGYRLWGLTMAPFALFDLLARAMPGAMVTTGLEFLVKLLTESGVASTAEAAKAIETATALALTLAFSGLLGALFGWIHQRQPFVSALPLGTSLGLSALLLAWWDGWGASGILLGAAWPFALGITWGLSMDWLQRRLNTADNETALSRRSFIGISAIASAGISLVSLGISRWLATEPASLTAAPFPPKPTPTSPANNLTFSPLAGLRPELTPGQDFFRVDINLRSPKADRVSEQARQQAQALAQSMSLDLPQSDHLLTVSGIVERPIVVGLEEILGLPRVDQFATLECISNPVAGDLIGTTLFSGARLKDVLALVGLPESVQDIVFRCADGYSESLPLEAALDPRTLLCYAMGGEALSEEHGFPFRLYTHDRFGMKNPKWLVAIEAVREDYSGYWQQRGWDEQAYVKTETVIDAIKPVGPGRLKLAGIAFAGARGISEVQVRVDQGAWLRADLNRPLSDLAWVQWTLQIENLAPGEHLLEARASSGTGAVQTALESDPLPTGATGYHRRQIKLSN